MLQPKNASKSFRRTRSLMKKRCYNGRERQTVAYEGAWLMGEYLLYDWKGKLRWAYLEGIYLVDPLYEKEFLDHKADRHLRPLYLEIN